MNSNEFSLFEHFNRLIGLWWLVLLITITGGVFGFIFFHLHPPVYEATASYFVTIDLNRFPIQGVREDLIQYNEDMAINTTQGALLSREVLNEVVTQLNSAGITLTINDLLKNNTIEREHDVWELRYRDRDPSKAQEIVNTWAQVGYQGMLTWQQTGKAPDYVIFQSPTLALVPDQPVLYGRNNMILAGILIGIIGGILLTELIARSPKKTT